MDSRLLKDYNISRLLGAGTFGAVIQCMHKLEGKNYAVKVAAADDDAVREIQNFVKIPNHKNLVQYYTCWEDSLSKTAVDEIGRILNFDRNVAQMFSTPAGSNYFDVMCIQMELCGHDLRSLLKNSQTVDNQKVIAIFIQLLEGIDHIHQHGLIHRDLKPENIFTSANDSKVVKIGDLGIATAFGSAATVTRTKSAGTQLYLAPEQSSPKYGKSVDIYALGIIFLEMLHPTVQPAFNQNSIEKLVDMVNNLKYRQMIPNTVKEMWPIAANTIQQMTAFEVSERPTCNELSKLFSNPLVGKIQVSVASNQIGDQDKGISIPINHQRLKPDDPFVNLVEEMKLSKSKNKQQKLIKLVTKYCLKNNSRLDYFFENFPDLLHAKFGEYQHTFLHYSVQNYALGAVHYFIERGLNVNEQNTDCWTPLCWAAYDGFEGLVEILLKAGANPNIANKWGETPLHYAARGNHVKIGAMLLSANADTDITSKKGRAFDVANKRGHTRFIEMLITHQYRM